MVGLTKKEEVPSTSDVSDILAVAHGPACGVALGNPRKVSWWIRKIFVAFSGQYSLK